MLREVPQGPIFDAVSKLVVLISDLQKGLFSACLFYVLRKACASSARVRQCSGSLKKDLVVMPPPLLL